MSLDTIKSKILDEASAIKDDILKEAKAKSDAILSEAETRAASITESMDKKGAEEKERIVLRRKSVASIDSMKVLLAKKQEIISACFDGAVEKIIGMDKAQYVEMLVHLGAAAGMKEGTLCFNAGEKAEISAKVAEGLNRKIPGGKFEVADETGKMRGGYILKSGNTFVDNTIESLVNEHKTEIAGDVSRMLFEN